MINFIVQYVAFSAVGLIVVAFCVDLFSRLVSADANHRRAHAELVALLYLVTNPIDGTAYDGKEEAVAKLRRAIEEYES